MKSALTYDSGNGGGLARMRSKCRRILDVGFGTGLGGFPASRCLGPFGPMLDAISLHLAPCLLGTQLVLVATPG